MSKFVPLSLFLLVVGISSMLADGGLKLVQTDQSKVWYEGISDESAQLLQDELIVCINEMNTGLAPENQVQHMEIRVKYVGNTVALTFEDMRLEGLPTEAEALFYEIGRRVIRAGFQTETMLIEGKDAYSFERKVFKKPVENTENLNQAG